MDPKYEALLRGSMFAKAPIEPGPGEPGYVDKPRPGGGTGGGTGNNPTPPGLVTMESNLALRGIVIEDSTKYAFVEALDSHTLYRLKLGETVAHGTVAEVTMADVLYDNGGKKTRVPIGSSFDGVVVTAAATYSSGAPGYGSPSSGYGSPGTSGSASFGGGQPSGSGSFGGPGGPGGSGFGGPPRPSGPASAIEEAMRRRRMEQGGGRPQ